MQENRFWLNASIGFQASTDAKCASLGPRRLSSTARTTLSEIACSIVPYEDAKTSNFYMRL